MKKFLQRTKKEENSKLLPDIETENKQKTTDEEMKGCTKMNKYEFKPTNLIAETFEERNVKFNVVRYPSSEQLLAGFSIDCGPNVIIRFISNSNDNAVQVCVAGLISKIPKEKKVRIMEACNALNCKYRYVKFFLDTDGSISVKYDFLECSPDDGIGEMAFELFARMMRILDSDYNVFMKALYTDEELDINE